MPPNDESLDRLVNKDQRVTEVLLNNTQWIAAEHAIASLGWETRDFFYSARLFLVLRRTSRRPAQR